MEERISIIQLIGTFLAGAGLALIGGFFDAGVGAIPPAAFLMCLAGALFWGSANIIVKRAAGESERNGEPLDMMEMLVWSSIFVPPPMLAIALIGDGPDAILQSLYRIDTTAVLSVLYLAFLSTLFGYYLWNKMIALYSAGRVAPFSFLVPITGLLSAMLILEERIEPSQWLGIAAVIVGLVVFQSGKRLGSSSQTQR